MPLYSYECSAKEIPVRYEAYVPRYSSPAPACPECGGSDRVEKIWDITQRSGYSAYPYITTNINGKPIEIKSARHLSQIEKQYNVRCRDDKSYIDEDPMRGMREKNERKRVARLEAIAREWRR